MNGIEQMDSHLRYLEIKPFRSSTFHPLSESEVKMLEERIGAVLPQAYRSFLTRFGEASFEQNVCFPIPDGDAVFEIGYFFGLKSIVERIESPPDTLPEFMIAIGDEGLGNLYCLGISGTYYGKIYYWDQQIGWESDADDYEKRGEPVPEDLPLQCVHLISDSFEAFVCGLVVQE
jgi:hypothetical protein